MSSEDSMESLLASAAVAQSPPPRSRPPAAQSPPTSGGRVRRESDSFYPTRKLDVVEFYSSLGDEDDGGGGAGGDGEAGGHVVPSASMRLSAALPASVGSCLDKVRAFQPSMWVFLALLGCLSALAGYTVDRVTAHLYDLGGTVSNTGSAATALPVWVLYSCSLALSSCAVCDLVSRSAEGSGIPEMKAFLAGAWLNHFLEFRTLVAKLFGLVLSLGSGLFIGKEGPFVHISACLASFMFSWPWFRKLSRNPALRRQMYAASVAAGVAAAFGTPIGGVLFSIEVTATYFLVSNLWKAFYAATWCVFALELFHKVGAVALFEETQFERFEFTWEVVAYAVLGVLCGVLGALFNYLSWRWMVLRDRPDGPLDPATPADTASLSRRASRLSVVAAHHISRVLKRRYLFVLVVASLTGVLTFSTHMLRNDERTTTNEMFRAEPLDTYHFDHWTHPSIFFNLVMFLLVKSVLTSVSIALPLPSGVLTPVFAMGAVAGRLYGETLDTLLPYDITPGTYAIVGAAALSSGVTHTLSIAVMVFELTGQLEHILPVLVAVLIAYSLSNGLCQSIYDVILNVKGLPYLPSMAVDAHARTAAAVVRGEPAYITRKSTYLEVMHMLERHRDYSAFPCVQSDEDRFVIATVLVHRLRQAVAARRNAYVRRLSPADARELRDQLQLRTDLRSAPSTETGRPAPTRGGGSWYRSVWGSVTSQLGGGRRDEASAGGAQYRPLEAVSPAVSPGSGGEETEEADEKKVEAAAAAEGQKAATAEEKTAAAAEEGDDEEEKDEVEAAVVDVTTTTTSTNKKEGRAEEKQQSGPRPPPSDGPARSLVQNFDTFMNARLDISRLPALSIDDAPLQVTLKTPLARLHYYFAMLDVEQVLLTTEGKLSAVVTKADLFSMQEDM